MNLEPEFWKRKSLLEMNEEEWEALCDGCGKCCYRKYLRGRGKSERIYFTRVACDLLNLETGKCGNYSRRFELMDDCTKLTKKNLPDFNWLPSTCAYRLLYENKPLFDWHPLISGNPDTVKQAGIMITNGVHEENIIDWFEFVIDEEN
jgi:Uncharacterized conserved protein